MSNVNTINANGEWYPIEDETARNNITELQETFNRLSLELQSLQTQYEDLKSSLDSVNTEIQKELDSVDIDVSSKVDKTGDTMTGNLTVNNSVESTDTYIKANSVWGGNTVSLQVGSGGTNRGIYDNSAGAWMLYTDSSNNVHLGTSTYGSGTKPIYLNSGVPTASSSTVGSTDNPVYLNNGTLTACGFKRYATSNTSNVSFVCGGYLTTSGTALNFSIPIGTALYGTIKSIIINNIVTRQEGNYGPGGSSGMSYPYLDTPFTQNRYVTNITLTDQFRSDYGFTNNACVAVNVALLITYS